MGGLDSHVVMTRTALSQVARLPACRATSLHHPSALPSPWQEVAAVRTMAQRGVMVVGTAHGTSLASLLSNPELRPLVGGVQVGAALGGETRGGGSERCRGDLDRDHSVQEAKRLWL